MLRAHQIVCATGIVLVLAVTAPQAGCFFVADLDCAHFPSPSCFDGGVEEGGPDGGDSGPPPSCIPSQNSSPVASTCGVFVSSAKGNDTTGTGTQAAPFATITVALAKGSGATIYACAGSTPYSEALAVDKAVTLFGALDCGTWAYDATSKTQLTAPADAVPLALSSEASGSEVYDFAITAANAMKDGGSSIAVAVDGATASLARCDLTAGDAMAGLAGASGGMQVAQANGGGTGDNAGTSGTQNGGAGGINAVCSLTGGMGGGGGVIANGNGGDGLPGDMGNGGAAGVGDMGTGCSTTPNGSNGATSGFGPGATGIGTLDANGYHGADGQPGVDGTNGTSAGGGGGSKASTTVHGAGGGGGGAGGCGGTHGAGGKAGGSSIALVSVGATVTMTGCALTSGKGESGGMGGDGQFGQQGGSAGLGGMGGTVADACNGGKGGKGGDGGPGGGGLGGHSLGIAATGTAPMLDAATQGAIMVGVKGAGGAGGNMNQSANPGAGGMAFACWNFSSNAACSP